MSTFSKKQISVEAARELQKNWNENQAQAIKKGLEMEDVQDFLFDLNELQEYLELVKKKSEEQGISKPGIRIYFGAYSADCRATVFLSPTKDTGDSKNENSPEDNKNIEPLNMAQGGFPPKIY